MRNLGSKFGFLFATLRPRGVFDLLSRSGSGKGFLKIAGRSPIVRALSLGVLVAASAGLAGCMRPAPANTATTMARTDIDCDKRPMQTVCCQAQTRSCIDCREQQRVRSDEWMSACRSKERPTGRKPRYVKCDPAQPNMPCTPDSWPQPGPRAP